ncbi:Saccharopine dehydrogenase [Gigaspora margarita]|uniref:Saccharopine dehydrogenase [NADP(+), L-glutamate-forming] n=1 Tax=Gigaspora margarita TaxID=4874 RepID=A0A8H4AY16_GIGMA|nr:Saccharopine dehydrogenase [Gigaspora margarita]
MATERKILLIGSGFVARPTVEYILRRPENLLTVACRRISHAETLSRSFPRATPISLDVTNVKALDAVVSEHDIVISLIPYILHPYVIKSVIKFKKNMVTTSYVSPTMRSFDAEAKANGLTIMNEIGLDPGIDHLFAVKTINEVHEAGGKIISFISYCGGLPAPEASNNPLGYKFSWSSRGVLLALKNSAKFYQDGEIVEIPDSQLMLSAKPYFIYPAFAFLAYPNRDSTPFREYYNIPEAKTILRGTLRYQGFTNFVKVLVDIGLLDDSEQDYLSPNASEITWKDVLAKVIGISSKDESDLRKNIARKVSEISDEELERIFRGFKWLGLFSDEKVHRKGNLLDTLCATFEEKMQYGEGERDMVILQHKFEIETKSGERETWTSTLLEYGDPNGPSAMAKTVGTPCGIAVQLILDGVIKQTGILTPYTPEINNPIIKALEEEGIKIIDEKL